MWEYLSHLLINHFAIFKMQYTMHITPHKDGIACSVIYKFTSLLGAKDNNEKTTSIDIINAEYNNASIIIIESIFLILNSFFLV